MFLLAESGSLLAFGSLIVGTVSGGFYLLWKFVSDNFNSMKTDLSECKGEHDAARKTNTDLTVRVCKLEGRHETIEKMHEEIVMTAKGNNE